MSLPTIVLENPKYSGNIGMVCRLISNFNLSPLRILGEPLEHVFEMEWMAHGAEDELEKIQYYSNVWDCKLDLDVFIGTGMIRGRDRGNFISLEELQEKVSNKNYGIVFGREDSGLRKSTVELCDFMIDFNLPGIQKSMNLSHSVAFVLGRLTFDDQSNKLKEPMKEVINTNHFFQYAHKVFSILGMNHFHGSENLAVKRFKTILEKDRLEQGDIDFLYKVLNNIEWLSKDRQENEK